MRNKKIWSLLLVMTMLVALVIPVQAADEKKVLTVVSGNTFTTTMVSLYDAQGYKLESDGVSSTITLSATDACAHDGQPKYTAATAEKLIQGNFTPDNDVCEGSQSVQTCFHGGAPTITIDLGVSKDFERIDLWSSKSKYASGVSTATESVQSSLRADTVTVKVRNDEASEWQDVTIANRERWMAAPTSNGTRNLDELTFESVNARYVQLAWSESGQTFFDEIVICGGERVPGKIRRGLISTGTIAGTTLAVYDLIGESAYQQSKPSATFTFTDTQASDQPQWKTGTAEEAFDGKMGTTTADGRGLTDETAVQVGWFESTCTAEIAFDEAVTLNGFDLWRAQDTGVRNIKAYVKENGEWSEITTSVETLIANATNPRTAYRVTFAEVTVEDLKIEFEHSGQSKFICEVLFLGDAVELPAPATDIKVISGNLFNEAAIARYAELGTTVTVADSSATITWNDADLDSSDRVASLSNGNISTGWTGEDSTSRFNESNKIDMYVDFEAPATFNRIDLWTFEEGANMRTKSFDVYVSDDKVDWSLQGSVANPNEADQPSGKQLELITFHCQPTTAQYIKIVSYDNAYQQVITELVVFGEPPVIPLSGTTPMFVLEDGTDYVADSEESAYEGFKAVTSFKGGEGTLVVGWYDADMKNLKKVWTATGRGDVSVSITSDEEVEFLDSGDDIMKAFVFGNMAEVQLLSGVAELNILGE